MAYFDFVAEIKDQMIDGPDDLRADSTGLAGTGSSGSAQKIFGSSNN